MICSGIRSPDVPRQDANDEGPFTFELASPAPEYAVDLPSPLQPTLQAWHEGESIFLLIEKIDKLADAVSRVEARLLYRLDMLEEAVKISESYVPPSQYLLMPCIPPAPLPMPPEMSTLLPLSLSYGQENSNSPIPVLQDASSRPNVISPSVTVGEYRISDETLNLAMQGCCPRQNLAVRLALKVYTLRERTGRIVAGNKGRRHWSKVNLKQSSPHACNNSPYNG